VNEIVKTSHGHLLGILVTASQFSHVGDDCQGA